jgi:hypothetical protein
MIEPRAMESIAAMPQTALDWLSAQPGRRARGLFHSQRGSRPQEKASMPARRAEHGGAP